MKYFVRILIILLFAGGCDIHAEKITITTSISASSLIAVKNLLHLNFSKALKMDSAWIVSYKDTTHKLLICHAQGGDYLNISKLERSYYQFSAQVGDSCFSIQFYKRDTAQIKELDIISADVKVVAPHTLQYSILEAGKTEAPHVDSVWIVGKNYSCAMPDEVYLRTKAQSGDNIDIGSLLGQSERNFQCVMWINGTDYWSNSFYYEGVCDAYQDVDVQFTNINPHHLILHITDAGEPAKADSMWITSKSSGYRTLQAGTAVADGDTIDLSPLVGMDEHEYMAWLRFGDCVRVYWFSFNGLEYDYCLDAGIWRVHIETDYDAHTLQYYLRDYDNQDINNIPVDSVWVTTFGIRVTPEYVCSLHALQGDVINMQQFQNGFYELFVQVGECVVSMPFQADSGKEAGIDDVRKDTTPAASKVLREGKIVIVRGGKTYTLTGQGTLL